MALMTQRAYARRRRISQAAVQKRTVGAGGPIPTHGPKKLIDPVEADALWEATKSAAGLAGSEQPEAPAPRRELPRADPPLGTTLAQARAASVVVDVQTKRLALEQRRGALISRDRAILKSFAFARTLRDMVQAWPARVGPQLAAAFDLDATAVTVYLDDHVRQLLNELASERVDF
jgi:hypothetical protein